MTDLSVRQQIAREIYNPKDNPGKERVSGLIINGKNLPIPKGSPEQVADSLAQTILDHFSQSGAQEKVAVTIADLNGDQPISYHVEFQEFDQEPNIIIPTEEYITSLTEPAEWEQKMAIDITPVTVVQSAGASETGASKASSPLTLARFFMELGRYTGNKNISPAFPNNTTAQAFKKLWPLLAAKVDAISPYTSVAGGIGDAGRAKANALVKKYGIEIEPHGQPDDIAAAVITDISVTWNGQPTKTTVSLESGATVPAFRATKQSAFYVDGRVVVKMSTTEGLNVYIMRSDEAPAALDLYQEMDQVVGRLGSETALKATVLVPCVDFKEQGDLSDFYGTGLGGKYQLTEGKYAHRLRMNQDGARAESAVVGATAKGLTPPDRTIEINGPFVVAFEDPQTETLLWVAKIETDAMKDPGSLQ